MTENAQGESNPVTGATELEHKPRAFFGAAMQGALDRSERAGVHAELIACIAEMGYEVVIDHTRGKNRQEAGEILKAKFPAIPDDLMGRRRYVRSRLIEEIEGNINVAVFEVSIPSLGTSQELTHAYLRPRMGIPEIPILVLYQNGYWPSDLSAMVAGISPEEFPNVSIRYYNTLEEAKQITREFLQGITPK